MYVKLWILSKLPKSADFLTQNKHSFSKLSIRKQFLPNPQSEKSVMGSTKADLPSSPDSKLL